MAKVGLSSPTSIATTGTNQVTTLTLTGGPTGGTFDITVGGQTASANAYDISAANLDTAIEGLSSVGAGDCAVARSGAGSAGDPYVYTITFSNALAATAVTVTADGASLTGGTTPSADVATATAAVTRAAGNAVVGNTAGVAVQLVPDAQAVGDVVVKGSLDGTNFATLHTETVAASTPVLVHLDRLPMHYLRVDPTGLTAGLCPATYAVLQGE